MGEQEEGGRGGKKSDWKKKKKKVLLPQGKLKGEGGDLKGKSSKINRVGDMQTKEKCEVDRGGGARKKDRGREKKGVTLAKCPLWGKQTRRTPQPPAWKKSGLGNKATRKKSGLGERSPGEGFPQTCLARSSGGAHKGGVTGGGGFQTYIGRRGRRICERKK